MTISTDPLHIAVSKSKGIKIDWSDGHKSDLPCGLLRDECPCASCTGPPGTEPQKSSYAAAQPAGNPFQMYTPVLKMLSIEEVGTYAVRINWSDGQYRHLLVRASAPPLYLRGVHHRQTGRPSMKLLLSLIVLLALPLATADVSGKWKAEVDVTGNSATPEFTFKQDGGKLSGTYKGMLGEAPVTGTVEAGRSAGY